jgi:hypothetical protein
VAQTRSLVTLFVICALLASTSFIGEQVEAANPQTQDIALDGYLALQITSSSAIPSFYDVLVVRGPNIDVILTDEAGFVDYKNGELASAHYSVLGTFLDTRHASYYGNMANGTYYLIIDNTLQGTAQPNGQTVRVTYSSGTVIAGMGTSSDSFVPIGGILTIGGLILVSAMVAIVALAVIYRSSRRKQSSLAFYDQHESGPAHQERSIRSSSAQEPNRIYLQAKPVVQPIRIHAIGRCPMCNGIIAKEWKECTKCNWTVDRSKLRSFK